MLGNTSENTKSYHNGTKYYCIFVRLPQNKRPRSNSQHLLDCEPRLSHHVRLEFKSGLKCMIISMDYLVNVSVFGNIILKIKWIPLNRKQLKHLNVGCCHRQTNLEADVKLCSCWTFCRASAVVPLKWVPFKSKESIATVQFSIFQFETI